MYDYIYIFAYACIDTCVVRNSVFPPKGSATNIGPIVTWFCENPGFRSPSSSELLLDLVILWRFLRSVGSGLEVDFSTIAVYHHPLKAGESKKQLEANQREQKRKAGHRWLVNSTGILMPSDCWWINEFKKQPRRLCV